MPSICIALQMDIQNHPLVMLGKVDLKETSESEKNRISSNAETLLSNNVTRFSITSFSSPLFYVKIKDMIMYYC